MMIGKMVKVINHTINLHTELKPDLNDVQSDLIIWKPNPNYIFPFTRRVHTQEYLDKYNAYREPDTEPMGPRHLIYVPIQEGSVWVIFEQELVDPNMMNPTQPHTQPRAPGEVSDFVDGLDEPDPGTDFDEARKACEEDEIIAELERRGK